MINEKVTHSIFGEGTITDVKDGAKEYQKYITVKFSIGEKKFVFPDVFTKILTSDNKRCRIVEKQRRRKNVSLIPFNDRGRGATIKV